jgi:hypothetical protein
MEFCSLPSHIISTVLFGLCSARDVGKVDAAFCEKAVRPSYLTKINGMSFLHRPCLTSNLSTWLLSRSLRPIHVVAVGSQPGSLESLMDFVRRTEHASIQSITIGQAKAVPLQNVLRSIHNGRLTSLVKYNTLHLHRCSQIDGEYFRFGLGLVR